MEVFLYGAGIVVFTLLGIALTKLIWGWRCADN